MKRIKSLNVLFDNDDHHDSHEFLTWLLNQIHEEIIGSQPEKPKDGGSSFVTDCFEGKLVSKTACFSCEYGNEREEVFMALSIDVEQKGTSLNHCIKQFAHKEWMLRNDKFYCESCQTKQVATRQMMIKKRP